MRTGPYVIRVSSQKGGVGKTTIAVNLATALRLMNYRVLLVDADYTNPSVGFHLGFDQVNQGFIDVVTKKVNLKSAIITHAPSGMQVLPGRIGPAVRQPDNERFKEELFKVLTKSNYDFAIVDTAPGYLSTYDYFKRYDEAIIVTTPEMAACTSAIRLARSYDKMGLKHSLIVNRLKNKGYEVSMQEIEESYEGTVSAQLPEDEIVPLGISERIPAYLLNRRDKFSIQIGKAAKRYGAKVGSNYIEPGDDGIGIISRILIALGIRRRGNRVAQSLKE